MLFFLFNAKSETLYWVGSDGVLNDSQNWSTQANGTGANKVPGIEDDLIIDGNNFEINVANNITIHSLRISGNVKLITNNQSVLEIIENITAPNISGIYTGPVKIHYLNNNQILRNDLGNWQLDQSIDFISSEWRANNPNGYNQILAHSLTVSKTDVTCNGASDGTATVAISGGTGPFVITWYRGSPLVAFSNSATVTGLAPGTYVVSVLDQGTGDTEWSSASIIEPASLAGIISAKNNVSCNGLCDGDATVLHIPGTGTGSVTYLWDDPAAQTTATATGLCAGTYTVTLADDNGCTTDISTTITEPDPLTIASSQNNVSCNGVCDGQAMAAPSGGTTPYSYLWDDPGAQTTTTASGLCAGAVNIVVTDGNGCTANAAYTITEPDALVATASGTNITCNGADNGTATVSVTGGTANYSYLWDDPSASTTASITGLSAGTYTVTVTDANGCTATDSYTVTEPTPLTVAVAGTDLLCFNVCDGDATATPSGGTAPYTYLWDDPGNQTTITATSLCAGLVGVTVTDFNGCTASGSVILTEPTQLTASFDGSTDASCFGVCDGDATGSAAGGTAPYTYLWDDPGAQTTTTATALCAGSFVFTVTDFNGCTATASGSVNEPTIVSGTIASNDVSCNGVCDGDATVTPAGGNGAPYTYLWDDGAAQTTATATGLCAGDYTVTITDVDGCTGTATVTITEPDPMVATVTGTDVTCNGDDDGTASVSVTGGTTAYSYLWDDLGASTTSGISGLAPGTYTVVVTDAEGCTDTDSYTVTEPTVLTATTSATDVLCFGDCDGDVTITPAGGTAPYTYLWDDAGVQATATATGLCAATYNGTVTDANGCTVTESATINEPSQMVITEDTNVPASCFGLCDGSTTISVAGGTAPYTYLWDDPGAQTTTTASGLCAGDFTITVTDFNGCTETLTITITEPTDITGTFVTNMVSCNGVCDADATVTPAGGNGAPYTYLWDDPSAQTSAMATALCAGTYNVTITDVDGCTGVATVIVTEPDPLVVATTSTNATCDGICDGTATATPTDGTAPYTYLWDDAGVQATATATGLCVGTFNVTVTDANGCLGAGSETITAPVVVSATITTSNNTSCNGACDGDATVGGAGGTPPYTYSWDDPFNQTSTTATGLCAGDFIGTVIDANGCQGTDTVTITEPDPITVTFVITDVLCDGDCDGEITPTISGGTMPYTVLWDDPAGQTTETATGLCVGDYTITITDANGCVGTGTATVAQPPALNASSFSQDPLCNLSCDGNGSVTPSGGTPPYTYLWDDPAATTDSVVTNLCDGIFTYTVTDANGCQIIGTITLTDPSPLTATSSSTDISCNGICDGTGTVTPSGGTPPYSYSWDDPGSQTTATALNLCAGDFDGTVTDFNGCTLTETITVIEPAAIVLTEDSVHAASCFGVCDGETFVSVAGGTPPYTYLWDDPFAQTTLSATGLCAGDYTLTVTDANSCSQSITVTVTEPTDISGAFTTTNIICNGDCDGTTTVSPIGGNGAPYTYLWDDPSASTTAGIGSLCAGDYTVIITDSNGCTKALTETITEPSVIALVMDSTDVICFGDCDGEVVVTPSGGVGSFSYLWDDASASTDSLVGSLCAGTYNVTVTDANGCTQNGSTSINEPAELTASIIDTVHVNCLCTGEAEVAAIGGTTPYTYSWNDPSAQTSNRATGLCAGTYNVTVTDFNGCSDLVSVTISDTSNFSVSITDNVSTTCNGDCDGSLTVTPVDGVLPYSYLWNDPAATTDSTASNLCEGTYNVTVTDGIGCVRFISDDVTGPTPLTGSFVEVQPLCFGDCNGSITVTASGQNGGPYTYAWNDPGTQTGVTASNLCAGDYEVEVTDVLGCIDTLTYTLGEPTLLTTTTGGDDINCNGACDGQVYTAPSGGTTPYSYAWDDAGSSTTDTVNSLCPNTYNVTVTDANGCTVADLTSISEPTPLFASITDTTHVWCNCVGEAIVTPSGGTAPYTYLWNDPSASTDSTATGLCAGNYSVTVTDANGCTFVENITIIDLSGFSASITDTTGVSCYGLCDGVAIATPTGGVLPYSYTWSDGAPNDSTNSNLCGGSYSVTVADNAGCTYFLPFDITNPDTLVTTIAETSGISCFGLCDGELTASVTGGTAPYAYSWNDPSSQITAVANGLCANSFSVVVTDANGCVSGDNYDLFAPAQLTALLTSVTDESCTGMSDGQIVTNVTGGTAPMSYTWTPNVSINNTASGLSAGSYSVTITDANGCTDDTSATVISPLVLSTVVDSLFDPTCNGDCDGMIYTTTNGGWTPYTYSWNDAGSQTSDDAIGLCDGNYTLTVTDSAGCTSTVNQTLSEPNAITITEVSNTATDCLVCNGSAEVIAAGGTGPYTYTWSNGDSGVTASNLCAQTYTVVVTDASGCQDSSQVTISGPNGLTVSITDVTDVSCNSNCDGEVVAAGVGGNAPYTYVWDDALSTANDTLSNACAQAYSVVLTDADGCTATTSTSVAEPNQLVSSITDSTLSACTAPCFGTATAGVSGGTAPYTYSWNDPAGQTTATAIGLCTSNYEVIVTDANGCQDTSSVYIPGPDSLYIELISFSNTTCGGTCDGSVEVLAHGGTGPYTYQWDDASASTSTSLSGLCAGDYVCTVTDAAGCIATYNITIAQPSDLAVSIVESSDVSCNGDCDGYTIAAATGGTLPYVYQWNDIASTSNDSLMNICPGTYQVDVTDGNGCSVNDNVTISEPDQLVVTVDNVVDLTCDGVCDGEIAISVAGGTAPYSYLWSDISGQTTATATSLCAGSYTVQVTDANGCAASNGATVSDADVLAISVSSTDVICNSDCDGTADVVVTGGTGLYSVVWDDGPSSTTESISNLCPADYIVTVTGSDGCVLEDTVTVNEPTVLVANITSFTNLLCNGVCNGDATVAGSGGVMPYAYSWSTSGNTSNTETNLCTGNFTATVTDDNGCSDDVDFTIGQPSSLNLILLGVNEPSCYGSCDGGASLFATGGVGSYTYDWDPDVSNSGLGTNLCAGDYTVTLTDGNGCSTSNSFTVDQPDEISIAITDTTHILCLGSCDGQATVSASGGTGPYSYSWGTTPAQYGSTASNLCVGTYNVEVTDNQGCLNDIDVEINDISVLTATFNNTNISCNGLCDGTSTIVPTGGVGPYTYSWNTGSAANSITDLCVGNYFVSVDDANGCSVSLGTTISQPQPLVANMLDSVDLICNGVPTGSATAGGTGGTPPYTYLWSDASVGNTATGLYAGPHSVVIEDQNGCQDIAIVTLDQPAPLDLTESLQDATCNTVNDGSVNITVTGGVGGYSHQWSGPGGFFSNNEDINNVYIGDYEIITTDANGCEVSSTVTVDAIVYVYADAGSDTSLCLADSILLNGSGGTEYLWSTNDTTSSVYVKPTSSTMYYLTVSDQGCADTDSVYVNINQPPVADAGMDQTFIPGSIVQLDGEGFGNNVTYSWNPPVGLSDPTTEDPVATPSETTTYELVVTDDAGCVDTSYVTITIVPGIIFPNGITPNGDGLNDTWNIQYIEQYEDPVVEIYNRWGQLLFRSVGYISQWDGTYNDEPLPVGTYYYVIELGGGLEPLTGPITIMR